MTPSRKEAARMNKSRKGTMARLMEYITARHKR